MHGYSIAFVLLLAATVALARTQIDGCELSGDFDYINANSHAWGHFIVSGSCSLERILASPHLSQTSKLTLTGLSGEVTLSACYIPRHQFQMLWLSGLILSGADCGDDTAEWPLFHDSQFMGNLALVDVMLRDYNRRAPLIDLRSYPGKDAMLRLAGVQVVNVTATEFVHTDMVSRVRIDTVDMDETAHVEKCLTVNEPAGSDTNVDIAHLYCQTTAHGRVANGDSSVHPEIWAAQQHTSRQCFVHASATASFPGFGVTVFNTIASAIDACAYDSISVLTPEKSDYDW